MRLMAYKSKLIILLILFVSGGNLFAQEQDFKLWTGVQIEKEIVNNLNLDLELNNRLEDNLNQRDESFLDLGIHYYINDLKLSILYRFSNENKKRDNYIYSNRFSYQLSYKYELQRFRIDLRSRYQSYYEQWFSSENGMIAENYFRNRIKLRYDISGSPIEPLISFESFIGTDQDNANQFLKQRISLGANYNINKKNTIGIVFHIQNEKNVSNPTDNYILSLSYSFKL